MRRYFFSTFDRAVFLKILLLGVAILLNPDKGSSIYCHSPCCGDHLLGMADDAHDKQVEIWKVKKLVKSLTLARGNGTSMISLVIPPRDQISRVAKMLADEYGTASNIKSRVNRLSVLGAITSEHHRRFKLYNDYAGTQQRLKLYSRVPPHGLVVYCGTIMTDEGKERRVNIDFEPCPPEHVPQIILI